DTVLGLVGANMQAIPALPLKCFKQGSLPIAEYYHKLNSMWREFDGLTKLPDCTCEARNEVVDHNKLMKLMQFLMGLDDVYQPIRSSILTREVLPEAKDAFVIISREESHRGIPNTSVKTDKPQVSTFNTKFNDANKRKGFGNWSNGNSSGNWSNGNNANKGNYDSLLCKNYGLKGHTIDRCFEIISYLPGFKRNPNLKPVNNLNNNNRSNNSDVRGSSVGNGDKSASPLSLRANQHMTNDTKNILNLIDVSGLNLTVGHPNGTIAKITHVGSIKLNNDVILFDVLVVPKYIDLRKGKILRTDSEFAGLYLFDKKFNVSLTVCNSECFSCYVSKDIWHNRLGHLANQASFLSFEWQISFFFLVYAREPNLSETSSDSSDTSGVNDLNFFDNFESNSSPETPNESPNDDEKGTPVSREGSLHQPVFDNNNKFGSDENAYHPGNDVVIYQHRHGKPQTATPIDENNQSEGNVGSSNEVPTFQNVFENQTEGVNLRRSSRVSKLHAKLNDYLLNNTVKYSLKRFVNHSMLSFDNFMFVSNLNKSFEPYSFKEASKDVNWINSINDEMQALYENGTWELVELLFGRKAIESKWVYRIKYMSSGEIERFKARLLAKGFNQKEGIDYEETFSPVVKISTVRCLIDLAVQSDWKLSVVTPLPKNIMLSHKETTNNKFLQNVAAYQKLVEKFIYLCMTRPDISYVVNFLSQHMHSSLQSHFDLGLRLLRRSVSGYFVFVNGSLMFWKSKRQATSSKSSAEAEYRAMASVTCEIMWVLKVLKDFGQCDLTSVDLFCENKSAIQIAANPIMHEKPKHFDMDAHLVREKVAFGLIKTKKVDSKDQVADVFTKDLGSAQHGALVNKLGMINLFAA
nr:hypothetical protein [Tanacetum cinerariifolium]